MVGSRAIPLRNLWRSGSFNAYFNLIVETHAAIYRHWPVCSYAKAEWDAACFDAGKSLLQGKSFVWAADSVVWNVLKALGLPV